MEDVERELANLGRSTTQEPLDLAGHYAEDCVRRMPLKNKRPPYGGLFSLSLPNFG